MSTWRGPCPTWKHAEALGLVGQMAREWDRICTGMKLLGICREGNNDQIVWMGKMKAGSIMVHITHYAEGRSSLGINVIFINSGKLKFPSKSSFFSGWYAKMKTSHGKIFKRGNGMDGVSVRFVGMWRRTMIICFLNAPTRFRYGINWLLLLTFLIFVLTTSWFVCNGGAHRKPHGGSSPQSFFGRYGSGGTGIYLKTLMTVLCWFLSTLSLVTLLFSPSILGIKKNFTSCQALKWSIRGFLRWGRSKKQTWMRFLDSFYKRTGNLGTLKCGSGMHTRA